jgi:hypothetical protein
LRTVKTQLYKFDELSDEAKEKAIDKVRSSGSYLDYDWYDGVYEDSKTIGKLMGIDIDKIYFSGFSSQGDGACFEGDYEYQVGSVKAILDHAPQDKDLLSIATRLAAEQKKYFYRLTAKVKHRGHYYHSGCTNVDVQHKDRAYYYEPDNSEDIRDLLREFMDWIYDRLEADHSYLLSDVAISEYLNSDDREYEKDGSRW